VWPPGPPPPQGRRTDARLVGCARDAADGPRVGAATLFDGAVYFHQPTGAPVRGGAAWTLPGPFCYELSVARPQPMPHLDSAEAAGFRVGNTLVMHYQR